jgi:hypothetical protein
MQKIKNALTPGHRHHHNATGANTGLGGGMTESNVTEVPPGGTATVPGGAVNVIVHAPGQAEVLAGEGMAAREGIAAGGLGGGMGTMGAGMGGMGTMGAGNLAASSVATSTSSASDYEQRAFNQNVGVAGTTAVVHEGVQAEICNRQEYVEVEDRPVLKERVERIVEHQPVEKRFVVETRPVGETLLAERIHVESAGVTERIIDRADGTVCPTGTLPVGTGGVGTGVAGGATIIDTTTTYNQGQGITGGHHHRRL